MDDRELRRVFDQVRLDPEREEAMLAHLLGEERMQLPMKLTRKAVAALLCAAALLAACAFTVASGLDQRILEYFGVKPGEEQLLAPGFAAVDMTSAADNGAEVHISQILFDRYHAVLLGELTAPKGTVLDRDDYHFIYGVEPYLADGRLCEEFSGGVRELKILEDEDPKDEHMSFLLSLSLVPDEFYPERLVVSLEDLGVPDDTKVVDGKVVRLIPPVVPGKWELEIPMEQDKAGWTAQVEKPLTMGEVEVSVSELYLSPVGLVVRLENQEDRFFEFSDAYTSPSGSYWWESITLADKDGKPVDLEMAAATDVRGYGIADLTLGEVSDPARFQGGTLSILGQTISLDGLSPAA